MSRVRGAVATAMCRERDGAKRAQLGMNSPARACIGRIVML